MNYITTNIRIPEEDYLRLKNEAARKRSSFSAVVREKISIKKKAPSKTKVEKIMAQTRRLAQENAKYLKGWNSLKALREIRQES